MKRSHFSQQSSQPWQRHLLPLHLPVSMARAEVGILAACGRSAAPAYVCIIPASFASALETWRTP